MVLLMDEDNSLMEDSSDVEYVCGDPKVEPRIGDEFQVEIPPLMSASKRAVFLSTPVALDDSSYSFLIGLPVEVMWIDGDDNVDMSQPLKSLRAKKSRFSAKIRSHNDKVSECKKRRLNLEAVPASPFNSWDEIEVASFVLGLYTFGKDFTQVKRFMEKKETGDIVLFYYRKFYNSTTFHTWSSSRKRRKRNQRCIHGKKLYSGWRQQQLLSRLIPSITDESQKQMLVNVSKSFAEGNIPLEEYVSSVKDLVGLRLLVDAVAIGKEKEDLTVLTSGPVKTSKAWFTVSPKPSLAPGLKAYNSLTSADIINQLTGCSRLSKARGNDLFWEAVWPRLLARGWHSEQTEDRSYFTSKDNIVFIVPGVKRFSRGKLVKGEHYFDSVSDILTKVASEPELLELETGGENRGVDVAENSSDRSDEEEMFQSDRQRRRYLKSPCSNRGTPQKKFTVVDTSLAAGGKLCDLRNLNAGSLVSELKTRLVQKDSSLLENSRESQNVEKSQVMPLDAKNQVDPMRFTIVDTSLKHREKLSGFRRLRRLPCDDTKEGYAGDGSGLKEETLEKVKDPSKKLTKGKITRRAETNHSSSPLLKRRLLSACVEKDKSCSRESLAGIESDRVCAVQCQNSTREEVNVDKQRYETVLSVLYMNFKSEKAKDTRTGPSSSPVETGETSEVEINGVSSISGVDNKCSPEELRTSSEAISSEQESNRPCLVSGSDKKSSSNDPAKQQEQAAMPVSISSSNSSSLSSNVGTTQELGSSEQQVHNNTDGPRRQSTRKRPLTTRALEALESDFLISKRMKSTVKPRMRESSRKTKHTAAKRSSDLELKGEDRSIFVRKGQANKPLDQVEEIKPSLHLNEARTESKALDEIEDSKPVLTEYPKLPPIIFKLPSKRR